VLSADASTIPVRGGAIETARAAGATATSKPAAVTDTAKRPGRSPGGRRRRRSKEPAGAGNDSVAAARRAVGRTSSTRTSVAAAAVPVTVSVPRNAFSTYLADTAARWIERVGAASTGGDVGVPVEPEAGASTVYARMTVATLPARSVAVTVKTCAPAVAVSIAAFGATGPAHDVTPLPSALSSHA
jgi:hypothetical protein